MKQMNAPAEIFRIIQESEAYQIERRLKTLDTNLFVFDKNFRDLKLAIEMFSEPQHIPKLFDANESEVILRHIMRFFHNYLAAAKTLVDHTRVLIQDWYRDTEFLLEYKEQVRLRFAQNPISAFIEDLRNYALHYSLPLAGLSVNVRFDEQTNEAIETVGFFIEKNALVKWSKWTKGKSFLESAEDHIAIMQLVNTYFDQVLDFHKWMLRRLEEIHAVDLRWLEEMRQQLESLLNLHPGDDM